MIETLFRYPGAKNKLLPILSSYINPLLNNSNEFCDVFVGGGSILLYVAQNFPHITLYANDKNYWMYCFWSIVSGNDNSKLSYLKELVDIPVSIDHFYNLRATQPICDVECAYRAIFFNRTTFSGIMNSGPIGGKDQQSKWTINCRYNSNTIKLKIDTIHKLLNNRTIIENKDVVDCISNKNMVLYCDPPYYVKGSSLYEEYMQPYEHVILSQLLYSKNNWILSYDDCPEIRELYKDKKIINLNTNYCINGKKSNWKNKNELLILG